MGRKILVPIELTLDSIRVLESAQADREEGDELVILHVVLDPSEFAGFYIPHVSTERSREELMEDARERMERFVSRYARGTRYILEFGFPYKRIPEVAERERADLIVMGSKRGTSRIEHLFIRSTSKTVLRNAPCEIKIVPLPVLSEGESQGDIAI
jgi:nucleotide-binding universal stress UspA family protein